MPAQQSASDPLLNPIAPVTGQIVTAIGTVIAGYLFLMPRFKRLARRQSEGAPMEGSLRTLYYIPQCLNALLCIGVVLLLITALIGALDAQHLLPFTLDT